LKKKKTLTYISAAQVKTAQKCLA